MSNATILPQAVIPASPARAGATGSRTAIAAWQDLLGAERVRLPGEDTGRNVTCETASTRKVVAVLQIDSAAQLQGVLRIASSCGVPLYPVSTGFNWGYGANLPAQDGCAILDLSSLDRIVEFDRELGTVTVEPGVTQQQLHDYLREHDLPYLVPVTGAGPHCSLMGNALERGYGITPHADHFGAVMSIEAVLPNGRIYRSPHAAMGCIDIDRGFKWGIGPYVDGLFTQGSCGIVTSMTIALARRPENIQGFLVSLDGESELERAVVAIRTILDSGSNLTGSINLMNSRRMLAMTMTYPHDRVGSGEVMSDDLLRELRKKTRFGDWNVGGVIYGDRKIVMAARRRIRKAFRSPAAKILFFDRNKIVRAQRLFSMIPGRKAASIRRQIEDLSEAFNVAEGAPCETALPLCYWKSGTRPLKGVPMNPARDGCGLIWYSPLVPMKPGIVRRYTAMVSRVCSTHGIEPLITLTSLSSRCFDSTVPILFDRDDPEESGRAQACYHALFSEGRKLGVLPYRVGIDQMDQILDQQIPYWDLVRRIKEVVDPNGIISPGRYCPTG